MSQSFSLRSVSAGGLLNAEEALSGSYGSFSSSALLTSGAQSQSQSFGASSSFRVTGGSAVGSSVGASVGTSGNSNSVRQIAQDLLQLRNAGSFSSAESKSVSTGASFSAFASGSASASASASGSASGAAFLSQIEQAILRSVEPIEVNEQEEIEVIGQRGVWANKSEVVNWRGEIPITEYVINQDANPEIITKRVRQQLEYIQELAIRYLRPPTPPAPGEIIINQEGNTLAPPAPPLIIRQQPARPDTPEPLVIREAPPQPPVAVGQKVITISGKRVPPPPRKVVIERLAPLPSKPQSVLVERWLPYAEVKRRVIFNKPAEADPVVVKPRNVIVQWEAPEVVIKKEFKYLGVIKANPAEYVQRYSTTLVQANALPQFVLDIKTPEGLVLAANYKYNSLYELEGDVQALKLVDLDKEGLAEYRAYLQKLGFSSSSSSSSASASFGASTGLSASASFGASASSSSSSSSSQQALAQLIEQIFRTIDRDAAGRVTVEDAEKVVLRLNSRLGRRYGEDDVKAFFAALDVNNDGSLDLEEFKNAFLNLTA